MDKYLTSDTEMLGADTELSPAAIDFLAAAGAVEDKRSAGFNRSGLDEYEQALSA